MKSFTNLQRRLLETSVIMNLNKGKFQNWAWWYMPIIPALGMLREEDLKFQPSLGYTVRLCLKKKKKVNSIKPGY
jgi:hypothetical protein